MESSVRVPTFLYTYLHHKPARGAAAWALLNQLYMRRPTTSYIFPRHQVVRYLMEKFSRIEGKLPHSHAVRTLLKEGDGVFWELRRTRLRLFPASELWRSMRQISRVAEDDRMEIPESAFRRLKEFRAWMSKAALTNHNNQSPISAQTSAEALRRSPRVVLEYRKILRDRGVMEIYPQHRYVRPALPGERLAKGEFQRAGVVCRQQSSLVVWIDPETEGLGMYESNKEQPKHKQKRYWASEDEYHKARWKRNTLPPEMALIRQDIGTEKKAFWVWRPVAEHLIVSSGVKPFFPPSTQRTIANSEAKKAPTPMPLRGRAVGQNPYENLFTFSKDKERIRKAFLPREKGEWGRNDNSYQANH